jgi:hypothetical protein
MEDGTRGRRGESALSGCEDRRVCRTRSTSSSEHKGEAKTQRSQPRRRAKRNRLPEVAPVTSVAIQIGLDGVTKLVAE